MSLVYAPQMHNPTQGSLLAGKTSWKRVDAPQPEFKRLADPHGLMNPGKVL